MAECRTARRLHQAHPLVDTLEHAAAVRLIGNTPLVRLNRFAARHGVAGRHAILLKAEWTSPGGSIKDRPALSIVRAAIERDELGGGKALLDSTSGNTGIAYAMLGAALGFPVELVVPESASDERKRILAAYGAKVTFSDPYDGSNGAIRLVREMAAAEPERWFYANQYGNPANPAAHFETTGPEIWRQTGGGVTHFIAGLGTTGTMMGTGAFLKSKKSGITLAAVQPSEAFHGIEGLKHLPTAIVPDIYDAGLPDRQIAVDTEEAYDLTRDLAATEGLFAGASTGAALGGALEVARELGEYGDPAVIVAIAPDGGGKYLSTGLWT